MRPGDLRTSSDGSFLLLLQDVERHDGIDHSCGRYLKGVEHLMVPENAREEVRPLHRVRHAAQRPNPFPRVFGYHEIFHTLQVTARGLMYLVVAVYVLQP